jgi:hypothetical protein
MFQYTAITARFPKQSFSKVCQFWFCWFFLSMCHSPLTISSLNAVKTYWNPCVGKLSMITMYWWYFIYIKNVWASETFDKICACVVQKFCIAHAQILKIGLSNFQWTDMAFKWWTWRVCTHVLICVEKTKGILICVEKTIGLSVAAWFFL